MADKIITVDKFFGLNESADGSTELKPGGAAVLENFLITDEYNMRTRPGIVRTNINPDLPNAANFEIVSERVLSGYVTVFPVNTKKKVGILHISAVAMKVAVKVETSF